MTYEDFQQKFEDGADKSFETYIKLSEDVLLNLIQTGQYDDTYQIWRALQVKGTRKSLFILFNIVSNFNNPYLIRYHACEALFKIGAIQNDEFKGMVQYGRDKYGKLIDQRITIQKLRNYLSL